MRRLAMIVAFSLLFFGIGNALTVYDIQFTDDPSGDSPYAGQTVGVSGIVFATGHSGDKYFICDPDGGPWHGVYIYDYSHSVSPGDFITITGTVQEFYNMTEIANLTDFSIDSAVSIPEPYDTTTGALSSSEAFEGVLVRVDSVVVTEEQGEYGLWRIDDGTGELVVDDTWDYSYTPTLGDTIASLVGVMMYSHDEYRLEPRGDSDFGIPETTDTSLTPIADIQADPSAFTTVTVEGVVTIGAGVLDTSMTKAYIQDSSGRGIQLFDYDVTDAYRRDIRRGNLLRLTGDVEDYQGTTEIKEFSYELLDTNQVLPEPYSLSCSGAASADWDGTLISLTGKIAEIYEVGGGTNVTIQDATGDIKLRIWETTGIELDTFAVGDSITVMGVGNFYFTGEEYQVLVAYEEDIVKHIVSAGVPPEEVFLTIPDAVFVPSIDGAMPIQFGAPAGWRITLKLFDMEGYAVKLLYSGVSTGSYSLNWTGLGDAGNVLPVGTYILLLTAENTTTGTLKSKRKPLVIGTRF